MELGQKSFFTGTVTRKRVDVGTRIEREATMIVLDEHQAPAFELRLKNNLFEYDNCKSLEPFVGKRVRVEGIMGSGLGPLALLIDSVSDISVISPPCCNKPNSPNP